MLKATTGRLVTFPPFPFQNIFLAFHLINSSSCQPHDRCYDVCIPKGWDSLFCFRAHITNLGSLLSKISKPVVFISTYFYLF